MFFFENNSKKLHICDLASNELQFKQIELDIDFLIPEFHRSIQDSLNNIYLIGGAHGNEKSTKILKFNS